MALLCWAVILLAGVACSSAELGSQTSVEEYPSIAQVENRAGLLWLQYCAASVLTSYHVLSTAQCFSGPYYSDRYRRIRAGTSYRGTGGLVREVNRVYIHPDFGQLGNEADIAVIRMQEPLVLGDSIKQAHILGQGIYLPTGLALTLVSWGTTTEGGSTGNNNLYELDLYTVRDYDCINTYYYLQDFPNNTITENMFCVGLRDSQGRNMDSRDVGAPLFYSGVTMGIVSFGVSDGEDSVPVVSTALASYSDWVVETATY